MTKSDFAALFVDSIRHSYLHQMSDQSFEFHEMTCKQMSKPELVDGLGSKFDFSGFEDDHNVECLRTRAEIISEM